MGFYGQDVNASSVMGQSMNTSAIQQNQSYDVSNPGGGPGVNGQNPNGMVMMNQGGINDNNQMIQEYKQKCKECVGNVSNLQLEIVSSASLPKGQIITINPLGLYGNFVSEREKD